MYVDKMPIGANIGYTVTCYCISNALATGMASTILYLGERIFGIYKETEWMVPSALIS